MTNDEKLVLERASKKLLKEFGKEEDIDIKNHPEYLEGGSRNSTLYGIDWPNKLRPFLFRESRRVLGVQFVKTNGRRAVYQFTDVLAKRIKYARERTVNHEGDIRSTLSIWESVLELDPDNPTGIRWRAFFWSELENYRATELEAPLGEDDDEEGRAA